MARRWLLTILTGTALSLGLAGTAGAQELDAGVAQAGVTADASERTLSAELSTDAEVDEAGTDVSPVVTGGVTPDGPDADVEGQVEVGGTELPIPQVVAPVEEAADGAAPGQTAAGGDVSPASSPATAGPEPVASRSSDSDAQSEGGVSQSRPITADRAAARGGLWAANQTYTYDESVLAPEVAPPAETLSVVAAAAPVATDLSLPVLDTTPTVPALLRLLAGLLVVGAAATWQTVRNELA